LVIDVRSGYERGGGWGCEPGDESVIGLESRRQRWIGAPNLNTRG